MVHVCVSACCGGARKACQCTSPDHGERSSPLLPPLPPSPPSRREQAERLRAKAQRPESGRSMQQACRYLYYLGRIRAVQLEYSEAKDCLQQAARKVGPRLERCANTPRALPSLLSFFWWMRQRVV